MHFKSHPIGRVCTVSASFTRISFIYLHITPRFAYDLRAYVFVGHTFATTLLAGHRYFHQRGQLNWFKITSARKSATGSWALEHIPKTNIKLTPR